MTGVLCAAVLALQTPRYRPMPVEETAATAVVAGVATVEGVSVRRDPEVNAIYTDAVLRFDDVWKGAPPERLVLTRYGGVLGGERAFSPGLDYELRAGERVAVFAVPFRQGAWTLVGSRQGLFRVSGSPPRAKRDLGEAPGTREGGGPPLLSDLKRAVFAALGRPLPPEEAPAEEPAPAPRAGGAAEAGAAPEAPAGRAGPAEPRDPAAPWSRLLIVLAGLLAVGLAWLWSRSRRRHAAPGQEVE